MTNEQKKDITDLISMIDEISQTLEETVDTLEVALDVIKEQRSSNNNNK